MLNALQTPRFEVRRTGAGWIDVPVWRGQRRADRAPLPTRTLPGRRDSGENVTLAVPRSAEIPCRLAHCDITSLEPHPGASPPVERSRAASAFRGTQNNHGQRTDARRKTRAGLGRLSRCRGRAPRKSAVLSNGRPAANLQRTAPSTSGHLVSARDAGARANSRSTGPCRRRELRGHPQRRGRSDGPP